MKTCAVILAGGVGERFGFSMPKQYIRVAGKPIIEHTLDAFQSSPFIDSILVVVSEGWKDYLDEMLGDRYSKVADLIVGGATRSQSTMRAIEHLSSKHSEDIKVVIHDSVRPLVDPETIRQCVNELDTYQAVDVVIPSSDTIVSIDDNNLICGIPDRNFLRRGQTPQAFLLSTIEKAYFHSENSQVYSGTDDCGIVLNFLPSVSIKCITGTQENIKVTFPVDLYLADKIFQMRATKLANITNDCLEIVDKVIVVLGASSGIGEEITEIASTYGARVCPHSRSTTGLNICDSHSVEKALKDAFDEYGRIDAVVITAGTLRSGKLINSTLTEVLDEISCDYIGPVIVARESFKYLRETQGHLVFFTSSSYTRGRENYALYSSSKAAVVNLMQALSDEWAEENIHVNAINPERTDTPMRRKAFGQEDKRTLLSPKVVAEATLKVLSSPISGSVIDIKKDDYCN